MSLVDLSLLLLCVCVLKKYFLLINFLCVYRQNVQGCFVYVLVCSKSHGVTLKMCQCVAKENIHVADLLSL